MRWLMLLLISSPFYCLSQQNYLAGYESKFALDFSQAKIEGQKVSSMKFDSSISDDVGKELIEKINQPGFFEKMVKEQLGEQLTLYMNVRATPTTAELEGRGGMQVKIEMNQRYEDGKWLTFDKSKKVYEVDSSVKDLKFYYTDKKKEVLGYTCYEMRSADTSRSVVVWICKDLPPTISPGLKFKSVDHAIFEFLDEKNGNRIVLRSIRKID